MSEYTIKDLQQLAGIKAHTIRIWEQRYSFLKPKRSRTNIRYYSADELKMVLNIALLNQHGYRISRIDKMSEAELQDAVLSLSSVVAAESRQINKLIALMIELNMDEFEIQLSNAIGDEGIEKTLLRLIFPFLERIGILWVTNHINPAQEHLVSNIIRQKILVGINDLRPKNKKKKSVILFLPEGEQHELGLLYAYYIMKKHEIDCIYLGADLPLRDLQYVAKVKQPEYIFTHLTNRTLSLNRFLIQYKKLLPSFPLVISGKLTHTFEKRLPSQVFLKKDLDQVSAFISSL